jgi:uncharacterized protein
MWRLIFLGLLIWLIIHFVRHYLRQQQNKTDAASKVEERSEAMVKCEVCAIHLPRSEAYQHDNRYYCSQAHLPKKDA